MQRVGFDTDWKEHPALLNQRSIYKMSTIDTKTVKHVAHLVRLGISEEEAQTFSGQFSSIIDYFNMLNEVDTENVPPASDIANAENVLREDVVKPSMSREEFLKNAPKSERGYVKVPTVLGEE
jgi:aspartyl-tRNA(Asn)/glutamyl-tRNA(Gln) amidotransferase subunit C